jgi:hypothetical protein
VSSQNLARNEFLNRKDAKTRSKYTGNSWLLVNEIHETLRLRALAVPYFLIRWEIGAVLSLMQEPCLPSGKRVVFIFKIAL